MGSSDCAQRSERTATRIGRYEVLCKLGVGGMADVYLAHQPGPFSADKLVVIKQLRPGIVEDDQFVQMFADEARIAVRLNHPNVVHTYEVVANADDYYLILEFLDGKSLHQVLQRVSRDDMPLPLHIWVLTQVLTGLHYAHELNDFDGTSLGIVHRDVSPSNVILTYTGEVKLLDFGIAKAVGAISSTREGLMKGKLGYAAPEQCLCQSTDARTDVFSVGVMLWEAIAKRKRSIGETEASTYQARIQGTELSIKQVFPSAPRDLIAICDRALARNPEQRFPSALAFRQALDLYLRSIGWDSGTERLGEFMRGHFHEDIVAMRQCIDNHLGNSRALASRAYGGQVAARSTDSQSAAQGDSRQIKMDTLSEVTSSPLSWFKRTQVWLIACVVGVLGLGAWLLRPVAAIPNAPLPASSPSAASSHATVTPEPQLTQPVGQISVTLAATPNSAILRLDGRRISNPYRAVHGADRAPHHLTATLTGYQTVEQELVFERDVDVALSLALAGARGASGASRSSVSTSSDVGTPGSRTTTAQPGGALPGDDLRNNSARPKARDIDEMDPYKR